MRVHPSDACRDLADRLRGLFPAWRRRVTTSEHGLRLWFGCGHRISGSYMVEVCIELTSLEPLRWDGPAASSRQPPRPWL